MVISMMKQDLKAVRIAKENTGIGKTMAAADIGKTVAAFPGNPAAAAATAFDSGKTVAVMKKENRY